MRGGTDLTVPDTSREDSPLLHGKVQRTPPWQESTLNVCFVPPQSESRACGWRGFELYALLTPFSPFNARIYEGPPFFCLKVCWFYNWFLTSPSKLRCKTNLWLYVTLPPQNESHGYFLRFWDSLSIVHSIDLSLKWTKQISQSVNWFWNYDNVKSLKTKKCHFEISANKVFII